MLNALASNRKRAIHRQAMRKAGKLVLDHAKAIAPVQSGAYVRSLTVRALPKSRRWQGVRVTQKEIPFRGGKKGKVFYGAFLELGYTTAATRRRITAQWDGGAMRIDVRTRRVQQRKIPGKWIMRRAGTDKESAARDLYIAELKRMISQEEAKL